MGWVAAKGPPIESGSFMEPALGQLPGGKQKEAAAESFEHQLTSGLNRKLKYKSKFWSVLGRFPAKLGPKTPPDGSGSENGAERT